MEIVIGDVRDKAVLCFKEGLKYKTSYLNGKSITLKCFFFKLPNWIFKDIRRIRKRQEEVIVITKLLIVHLHIHVLCLGRRKSTLDAHLATM